MKITFIIVQISNGGAERVVVRMANYWAEKNWDVRILSYEKEISPNSYNVHPSVKIVPMDLLGASNGIFSAIYSNFRRFFALRKHINASNPDAVLVCVDDISTLTCLVSMFGKKYQLIVSEIGHPQFYTTHPLWQKLKKWSFRFADTLILQTYAVKEHYKDFKVRQVVIRNPLTPPPAAPIDYGAKVIASVGRLHPWKNFPMLIRAFASLPTEGWQLRIFGQGDERPQLEQLITDLGVTDRVELRGFSKNVQLETSKASIFAFPSLTEGYPNALIEAMSQGLACVSADCPCGPNEIIESGKNGLLVPNNDEAAFAETLDKLMKDSILRKKLGTEAQKLADAVSMERVMGEWEDLLRDNAQNTEGGK